MLRGSPPSSIDRSLSDSQTYGDTKLLQKTELSSTRLHTDGLKHGESSQGRGRRGKRDKKVRKSGVDCGTHDVSEREQTQTSFQSERCIPQRRIEVMMDSVKVDITPLNYKGISDFSTMISKLKNGRPERSIKPFFRMKSNVTTSGDKTLKQTENPHRSITLAWWHYAIFSVIRQVRKRRLVTNEFCPPNKFNWNEQRRDREEYISIYSLVRKGIALTMEEYCEIDLLMLED